MLTEDSGANNKMSYLCSASGQFSAVEMVSPVGVWMRMASRYLAANRMDIPYLVSQCFHCCSEWTKSHLNLQLNCWNHECVCPRIRWTLFCCNLLCLSSWISGVSLKLIMETWYTWMLCIHEGHNNVNHECKLNWLYSPLSWRSSTAALEGFCIPVLLTSKRSMLWSMLWCHLGGRIRTPPSEKTQLLS